MWFILGMTSAAVSLAPIPSSDEELVAAFKAGDVQAFDALFTRYRQPIFGYLYRSVGDAAVAEELAQEVFLKVFQHLRRTSNHLRVHAWMYRIATTTCIDALRTATRRPVLSQDDATLAAAPAPTSADPVERQLQREQHREVRRALNALPTSYLQVLVLRQFEGLSYAESAEVMGISVEAVTSLIHRARQAFRATYSR